MEKAISYSLFGYGKGRYDGCFSFDSYLSGLLLSIRFNALVFPGWVNVVETDKETYDQYQSIFNYLQEIKAIRYEINENSAELCEAMLWRMKPIFWRDIKGEPEFSHVLCRDLDSLHTHREAQAVQVWVNNGRAAHAITDSVSHTIPLLGGMIGFVPREFTARTEFPNYDEMMRANTFDMAKKGADQKFLNKVIYPKFSQMGNDSITQHYFKGHANTWLSDFHTCQCWLHTCRIGHKPECEEDVSIPVKDEMKATNEISEHMGAAGYNNTQVMDLIRKYKVKFEYLDEIEQQYPNIFHWVGR